jgi:hypothetical protein
MMYSLQSWRTKVAALTIMLCAVAFALLPGDSTAHAQSELQWVHNLAGSQEMEIRAMSLSVIGEVFIAGTFRGTIDLDPGPGEKLLSSGAGETSFIAKYDPVGALVWAYRLAGEDDVIINDIVVDPMSQVGVIGSFSETADLDPGPGVFRAESQGDRDIFLLRLLPDGNLQWAWAQGDNDDDEGYAIVTDQDSGLFVTGKFEGEIAFHSGNSLTYLHNSIGGSDVFAARFSNSGNMLWVRTFGSEEDDEGTGIGLDGDRNVYVVGTFSGVADIDPQHTSTEFRSHGREDIFLSVISFIGNSVWQTYLGGTGDDGNAQILVEPDKSFYIAGEFANSADFDVRREGGNFTSRGASDIFLAHFLPDRNFEWVFGIGGGEPDTLAAVDQDVFDNVYILGNYRGTVDFAPGDGVTELSSSGGVDIFVGKYSRSGQLRQLQGVTGPQDDRARDIAITNSNNVLIVGEYSTSLDLGSGLSISTGKPEGVYHSFVAHYAFETWTLLPSRAYLPGIIANPAGQ